MARSEVWPCTGREQSWSRLQRTRLPGAHLYSFALFLQAFPLTCSETNSSAAIQHDLIVVDFELLPCTCRVWEFDSALDKWACSRVLTGPEKKLKSVDICKDGRMVVAGCQDKKIWCAQHDHSCTTLFCCRPFLVLTWFYIDNLSRVWDLRTGMSTATAAVEGHTSSVKSVAIGPSMRWVVSGSADNSLRCVSQAALHTSVLTSCEGLKTGERRQPSHKRAEILFDSVVCRVWDLVTQNLERECAGHRKGVTCVDICPASLQGVSCSEDQTIRCVGMATMLHGHAYLHGLL